MEKVRGITDLTLVHELGQPNLSIKINRARIARYGLNAEDINKLIAAAIGGDVAADVAQGERQFDLLVRLQPQYRDNPQQIGQLPGATPGAHQPPLNAPAELRRTTRK